MNQTIRDEQEYLMQYSYDYGARKIPMSKNPPLIVARDSLAQIKKIIEEGVLAHPTIPSPETDAIFAHAYQSNYNNDSVTNTIVKINEAKRTKLNKELGL